MMEAAIIDGHSAHIDSHLYTMQQLEDHFAAYLDPVNDHNETPVTEQLDSAA